jgi:hypothetical protein
MKTLILLVVTGSFLCAQGLAQPCTEEELLKIAGQWKGPKRGSVDNVSKENLARENSVLMEIHKMVNSGYKPYGLNASYGFVFGYNVYNGKNWTADPYEYGLYLLQYLCHHEDKDIRKMWVNPETSTSIYISVNKMWRGGLSVFPADYPDDQQQPFSSLASWPVQKANFWYFLVRDSGTERSGLKHYQYLVTYQNKLPFKAFTRKDFLLYKIPRMKYSLAATQKSREETDPNFDAASKRVYENLSALIAEQQERIRRTEALLRDLTPAELEKGAIVINEPDDEFSGFRKEGEPYARMLVVPDLSYYRPLPKWTPQFFCIDVRVDTRVAAYRKAIADIERAIDFTWFRSMLGNVSLIPATGGKQVPVAGVTR